MINKKSFFDQAKGMIRQISFFIILWMVTISPMQAMAQDSAPIIHQKPIDDQVAEPSDEQAAEPIDEKIAEPSDEDVPESSDTQQAVEENKTKDGDETASEKTKDIDYDQPKPASIDFVPPAIQSSVSVKFLMAYGRNAFNKANYSAAFYAYSKAITLDPKNVAAHYSLAWTKINAGLTDYKDIMRDLNSAIVLNSNFAAGYNTRGIVNLLMENYEQAIADFTKAVAIDNNFEAAYTNRAYAKYIIQDYNGAILDYGIAIVLNPNSALAYNNRALAKYADSQFQEALYDINKALVLDPKFGQGYSNRAAIKQAMNINNDNDLAKAKSFGITIE
ncbi:MAG: tetratricopeptide repeat protein [Alphaproteobacteria bacterium]